MTQFRSRQDKSRIISVGEAFRIGVFWEIEMQFWEIRATFWEVWRLTLFGSTESIVVELCTFKIVSDTFKVVESLNNYSIYSFYEKKREFTMVWFCVGMFFLYLFFRTRCMSPLCHAYYTRTLNKYHFNTLCPINNVIPWKK